MRNAILIIKLEPSWSLFCFYFTFVYIYLLLIFILLFTALCVFEVLSHQFLCILGFHNTL